MVKSQLNRIKKYVVSQTGNWFYPAHKLPVGTHFPLFLKHRVLFNLEIVFDVGANVGHFSNELKSYNPKTSFYCFEPFPETFIKLKTNLSGYNFNHYQLALGDQIETILVRQNDSNRSDTNSLKIVDKSTNFGDRIPIQVSTLDEFLEKSSVHSIDLLKIDTEGFDLKVLIGSKKALEKGKVKLIYIECGLDPSNKYHVFFPEILSFLTKLDYVFVGFFQTDIRKIEMKTHFSNALFVHRSVSEKIKTFN